MLLLLLLMMIIMMSMATNSKDVTLIYKMSDLLLLNKLRIFGGICDLPSTYMMILVIHTNS